jgi:hypothetical protein
MELNLARSQKITPFKITPSSLVAKNARKSAAAVKRYYWCKK